MSLFPLQSVAPGAGAKDGNNGNGHHDFASMPEFASFDAAALLAEQQKASSVVRPGLTGEIIRVTIAHACSIGERSILVVITNRR